MAWATNKIGTNCLWNRIKLLSRFLFDAKTYCKNVDNYLDIYFPVNPFLYCWFYQHILYEGGGGGCCTLQTKLLILRVVSNDSSIYSIQMWHFQKISKPRSSFWIFSRIIFFFITGQKHPAYSFPCRGIGSINFEL